MKEEALKLAEIFEEVGRAKYPYHLDAAEMLRKLVEELDKKPKPLNDEEIYDLWCDADNTEYLPEMRMKNGSINYVLTTFVQLIEERHGIK